MSLTFSCRFVWLLNLFFEVIGQVERIARRYIGIMISLLEGDAACPEAVSVSHIEFEMTVAHHLAPAVAGQLFRDETGGRFSGPNGANWTKYLVKPGVMSFRFSTASISISGISCSGLMVDLTTFSNLSLNASTFSGFMVSPAAYICPPNCSRRSPHALMAHTHHSLLLTVPIRQPHRCSVSMMVGL